MKLNINLFEAILITFTKKWNFLHTDLILDCNN